MGKSIFRNARLVKCFLKLCWNYHLANKTLHVLLHSIRNLNQNFVFF